MTPALSLYYLMKPYVPWRVRMALRRLAAERKRARVAHIWPIDESTSRRPSGWTGWPGQNRFAVVLTHDVEGPSGYAQCRALAEVEMALGFRSSFNFIPEGDYAVAAALREWLTDRGFEVGVHDLRHDGKLFRSRRQFERDAERINRYLDDWHACGFRAGFMLRNMEWMHRLHVAYDASTFDTDPFEPQSDAVGTIFPFWEAAPSCGPSRDAATMAVRSATKRQRDAASESGSAAARGFVELPYTLPQDSTMFLVMRESSPEIWIRKADWIAGQSGMVLVNVHPDYIRADGAPSARTYPIDHYVRLLTHIRERYAGQYWQPLPRELAAWVSGLTPRPTLVRESSGRERSRDASRDAAPPVVTAGNEPLAESLQPEWVNDYSIQAWDRFVRDHAAGAIAYTSNWRNLMEHAFPHIHGRFVAIRGPDGDFRSGLAVYTVRSALLGNRLVSVPFASISGPLAAGVDDLTILVRFLSAHRAALDIGRLEIRLNEPFGAAPPDGGTVVDAFKHHALDLRRGEDILYSRLSRKCVRTHIQKAARSGVEVATGCALESEWDEFHRLYSATRHRLGLPVMPRRFFSAMHLHLPPESFVLQLARREGVVLGAGLSLVFNGTWLLEWVGDSPAGRSVGANQALYWSAIRAALARQCHTFSFGRTAVSNHGLLEYKRHWGAIESDLPVLVWGDTEAAPRGTPSGGGRLRELVKPAIAAAPQPVYELVSDFCYRHLG